MLKYAILVSLLLASFAGQARAVTIDWLPVGNPGNPNDIVDGDVLTAGTQTFGAVSYAYNISKYDVTNAQYTEFLNAKDATGANLLGLYDTKMGQAAFFYGGITSRCTF